MATTGEIAAKVTEPLRKEDGKRRHHQEKVLVAKYKVGETVWLERPSKLSEHCQATYYVPADVQKQLGEDTYTLKIGKRLYRDQHHSRMKPCVPDPRGKHV